MFSEPRELIEPQPGAKRYTRRDERGRVAASQVDVGRSPSDYRGRGANNEGSKGQSDFLAWVRSEMDRRRISQRVIAKQAGINHSGLSRLLSGDTGAMRFATAVALTRALGGRMAVARTPEMTGRCPTCGHRASGYPMTFVDAQLDARNGPPSL